MRASGGRLLAIGLVFLGAALAACVGASSNTPNEDAGSYTLPDGGVFTVDGEVSVDGAKPPVDASQPDTGTDAGSDAGAGEDGGSVVVPDAGADAGVDAGPCGTNYGGCEANSTCVVDGGVTCVCDPGYAGTTCTSLCFTNHGGCDPDATCSNGSSGVVCTCFAGYSGNGITCFSNDYTDWPAPSDDPQESQYIVSGDGVVVTDTATHLVWQRQIFADPCPSDGTGTCSWADATAYCNSLNTEGTSGLEGVGGWRLPSLVELVSLINYEDDIPRIDTSPFPLTPPASFWSQTAYAITAGNAWTASFDDGSTTPTGDTSFEYVRCVTSATLPAPTTPTCGTLGLACCYAASCGTELACSSGACVLDVNYQQGNIASDSPLEAQYQTSSDGTIVHDSATHLFWQRTVPTNPCPSDGAGCTWVDAQAYCASLDGVNLGGISSGWRLPSYPELAGILSYSTSPPQIDTSQFGNTPGVSFWTQTPYAITAGYAWTVEFQGGSSTPSGVTGVESVRCVSAVAPSGGASTCGASTEACCYQQSCGTELTCNASTATCELDTNFQQTPFAADSPQEASYAVSPGGSYVTDKVTGLVWQRQVVPYPCPQDADGGTASFGCTWADAQTYCTSLNGLAFGGYTSGWRAPALPELVSLVNYEDSPVLFDDSLFPGTPFAQFWTATPYAITAGYGWGVSFNDGSTTPLGTTNLTYVRCVNSSGLTPAAEGCGTSGASCCYASSCGAGLVCASGKCTLDLTYAQAVTSDAPRSGQYTISTDTLVAKDTVTGLSWIRAAGGSNPCPGDGTGACTFAHAATYCASLNASAPGGLGAGWRLPALVELASVANYGAGSPPYVTSSVFTGVTGSPYWSATLYSITAGNTWTFDFADASSTPAGVTSTAAPLCVNGN